MLFVGVVFSAVAMLLGIITKLPQGGGGLVNNLMVLSFFLPAPPFLPPQPPTKEFFDLEAAIAEKEIFYMRNPVVTRNGTQGPMPRPPINHRSAGSSNGPAGNATFTTSSSSFSAVPLLSKLFEHWVLIGDAIGRVAVVFLALSWPWLIIKYMHLLGSSGPAPRKPIETGVGHQLWQIQPHDPIFGELQITISERDQALAELKAARKEAREAGKKSAERDSEQEAALKSLRTERDDAVAELGKERQKLEKLEKGRKEEVEGLKEEAKKQLQAWKEEEKKWEEDKAEAKKGHRDDTQSWRTRVEALKIEKEWVKEAFGAKLKNILEGVKKEREGWGKEKEELKKEKKEEKEKMEREKKGLEEERAEEKKLWEEADDRAQWRIAELKRENKRLKEEAVNRESEAAEVEKKTAEEAKEREQKRSEEEATEAKLAVEKLEKEVLNGRRLIEDLQSDKRRDRQLLLELRAQLVRPTHAAPPSHMNPLRFGGPSLVPMGGPVFAPPYAPHVTNPPATPKGTFHPTLPPSSRQAYDRTIRFPNVVNQEVGLEIGPLPLRPVVRLPTAPPRRQIPSPPPPNVPKGPKGPGKR